MGKKKGGSKKAKEQSAAQSLEPAQTAPEQPEQTEQPEQLEQVANGVTSSSDKQNLSAEPSTEPGTESRAESKTESKTESETEFSSELSAEPSVEPSAEQEAEHSVEPEPTEPTEPSVESSVEPKTEKSAERSVPVTEHEVPANAAANNKVNELSQEIQHETAKNVSEEKQMNGHLNGQSHNTKSLQTLIEMLKAKLVEAEERADAAEAEREETQEQYDDLVEKVSHIKTSLGARLKKDAESLAECKKELAATHQECDRYKKQWEAQRMLLDQASQENRSVNDALETRAAKLEEDIANERQTSSRYRRLAEELETKLSTVTTQNLTKQTQLEHELDAAKLAAKDAKHSLDDAQTELKAQSQVVESLRKHQNGHAEQVVQLETQVREKNLLIGKLRHEAVVLNDHLTNALRMVKKDSEGQTVDKELVSNLFVQFATCARADTKKFEILQLIADFLGWDETRRSQVGLSRPAGPPSERSLGGVFGKFAEFLERESLRK